MFHAYKPSRSRVSARSAGNFPFGRCPEKVSPRVASWWRSSNSEDLASFSVRLETVALTLTMMASSKRQ